MTDGTVTVKQDDQLPDDGEMSVYRAVSIKPQLSRQPEIGGVAAGGTAPAGEAHVKLFVDDASANLRLFEASLLRLKRVPNDMEALSAVTNAVHKVAGAASLFGFRPLAEFLRDVEKLLQQLRWIEDGIDFQAMSLMLEVSRHWGILLDLIPMGLPPSDSIYCTEIKLREKLKTKTYALESF